LREEDYMAVWSGRGASIEMWAEEMANLFFLSDEVGGLDGTTSDDWIALEPDDWLPLIEQLDILVELDDIIEVSEKLLNLVEWEILPTALLEAPLDYLEELLEERPTSPENLSGYLAAWARVVRVGPGGGHGLGQSATPHPADAAGRACL
jgi:hypothetical protein